MTGFQTSNTTSEPINECDRQNQNLSAAAQLYRYSDFIDPLDYLEN